MRHKYLPICVIQLFWKEENPTANSFIIYMILKMFEEGTMLVFKLFFKNNIFHFNKQENVKEVKEEKRSLYRDL